MKPILCVGPPNVGKSSLFNLLTGSREKTANYSGVTVKDKKAQYKDHTIYDLPGSRSLWEEATDAQVTSESLRNAHPPETNIIYVANALKLSDDLIFFSQLSDLQYRMALVINFRDEMERSKVAIDTTELEKQIGCPVVLMNSRKGDGLNSIIEIIDQEKFSVPNALNRSSFDVFQDGNYINEYDRAFFQDKSKKDLDDKLELDYQRRNMIIKGMLEKIINKSSLTSPLLEKSQALDRYALHPVWGTLLFLGTLFLIFQAIFSVAEYPMNWIDGFFVTVKNWMSSIITSDWLLALVNDGIISGINGVVIFIPQIAILFLLLGILESTGYMMRIAYLSDRLLRKFGLSGHSVIPLMSGLACSIPAIMSTRSIKSRRERLLASMVTPFMTCSARIPVYIILIAVIVPTGFWGPFGYRPLAMLGMYLLGVIAALVLAFILSRFNDKNAKEELWILDLPNYRAPHWKTVLRSSYIKTKSFVLEAGKVIFVFSIIIWFLSTNGPKSDVFMASEMKKIEAQGQDISMESLNLKYSYMGYMGRAIEPAIRPLGYDWKIGIALLSSFAAREIFVGTLSTIYNIGSEEEKPIIERLKTERTPSGKLQFDLATGISLLLFYAFALQCMSTVAVMRQETGTWKWPLLQFGIMLVFAYLSALAAYQLIG